MHFIIIKKTILRSAALFFIFTILQCTACSQPPDVEALKSQMKSRSALFRSQVKDMTVVETMKAHGVISRVALYRKGDKYRVEIRLPVPGSEKDGEKKRFVESIKVYDGREGWLFIPVVGRQKIEPDEVFPDHGDPLAWASELQDARVLDMEKVQGRECYVVETGLSEKGTTKMWVDKTTLVQVKSETLFENKPPVSVLHSEFRTITDDFEMACKTVMREGEDVLAVIKVESISINSGLDDSLFDPEKVELPEPTMEDVENVLKTLGRKKPGDQ